MRIRAFVNGLFWKEFSHIISNAHTVYEYIQYNNLIMSNTTIDELITTREAKFDIQTIQNRDGTREKIAVLDDARIYVDIISNELRIREEKILPTTQIFPRKKEKTTRYELMDLS